MFVHAHVSECETVLVLHFHSIKILSALSSVLLYLRAILVRDFAELTSL